MIVAKPDGVSFCMKESFRANGSMRLERLLLQDTLPRAIRAVGGSVSLQTATLKNFFS
jgi:hypothetical protein